MSPPIGLDGEITISADLLFERITPEEVWSCTSCKACDENCPVNIEILDKILDMRRYLTLMESDFPTELGQAFQGMENQGNPWKLSLIHIFAGIHLNMAVGFPGDGELTESEGVDLAEMGEFLANGCAYQEIQGKNPQTLAYGLADSPAGLAGWILEKFWAWTDHDGNLFDAVS